ncbi:hypothetical protein ACTXT7_005356 [Hymenolepis weldensis]
MDSNSRAVRDFFKSVDTDRSKTIDAKELLAALEYKSISEEAIQHFIEQWDKDHDGKLNIKELKAFLKENGFN